MNSQQIPQGWKLSDQEIFPRNNQQFKDAFEDKPRINSVDLPKSLNYKPHKDQKKLPKIISLENRVFYFGDITNNSMTGIGVQRIIDQSGIDQIYEGYFIDGILNWGRWWWADEDMIYYYEGSFLQGKPHGKNGIEMDSNGEKSVGDYNLGKKVGLWKFMSVDNVLMDEGMVTYGQRQGPWKSFFTNGAMMSEGNYEDGQRIGLWSTYHENGRLETQGSYQDERRDGQWSFYNKNGQKDKQIEYCQGHQVI